MKRHRHSKTSHRTAALFALLLAAAFLFGGCAVIPPDIGGPMVPADATQTPEAGGGDGIQPQQGTDVPNQGAVQPQVTTSDEIASVDVFLTATQSMMGFADTPFASLYENTVDAVQAGVAQSFPQASRRFLRADISRNLADAVLDQANITAEASQPEFYLIQDMISQPQRVKLLENSTWTAGRRMNEFKQSYYAKRGLALPQGAVELAAPVAWAISQMPNESDHITVILTDLSELQTQTGELTRVIQDKVFGMGKVLGMVAMRSEFSGFIPVHSAETLWYEWGDQPSGSLEKMLDYGNYQIGVTLDEKTRSHDLRPMYVLCIGPSEGVENFLTVLKKQLDSAYQSQPREILLQMFDTDFARRNFSATEHVKITGYSTSGVNVDPGEIGRTGLSYVQLEKTQDSSQRYIEFTLEYTPKASDYRAGQYTSQDFSAALHLVNDKGETVALAANAAPVTITIGENTRDKVAVKIRFDHPVGMIESGNYTASVSVTLNPPKVGGSLPFVESYHADSAGQAEGQAFDGSRTIGLSGFVSALLGMQSTTLAPVPLGTFTYPLYVLI